MGVPTPGKEDRPESGRPAGSLRGPRRPFFDLFPPALPARPAPAPTPAPPQSSVAPAAPAPVVPTAQPPEEAPLPLEGLIRPKEQPLPPGSDREFLYHSASYDRSAQAILGAIGRRERIVVLTGEAGTGKTTLCRTVMEQLDRRTFASFVAEPFVTLEGFLRAVLGDFGVFSRGTVTGGRASRAPTPELRILLRDFLRSLDRLDAFAVVFVDEAQNISPDLLDELCALSEIDKNKCLIEIILVGEPVLLATLRQPAQRGLRDRVSVFCELGPLSQDEIADYVGRRFAEAGDTRHLEFDGQAMTMMYAVSRGVPLTLNTVLDRTVALATEKSVGVVKPELVNAAARDLNLIPPARTRMKRRAIVAISLILLLIGVSGAGGWYFRDRIARAIVEWQAVPQPPPGVPLRILAPIEPIPPPIEPVFPQVQPVPQPIDENQLQH